MRSSLLAGARRLLHSSAAQGAAAGTPVPGAAQSAARKTSKRWLLHRYAPVDVRLLATAAVLSASAAVALRRPATPPPPPPRPTAPAPPPPPPVQAVAEPVSEEVEEEAEEEEAAEAAPAGLGEAAAEAVHTAHQLAHHSAEAVSAAAEEEKEAAEEAEAAAQLATLRAAESASAAAASAAAAAAEAEAAAAAAAAEAAAALAAATPAPLPPLSEAEESSAPPPPAPEQPAAPESEGLFEKMEPLSPPPPPTPPPLVLHALVAAAQRGEPWAVLHSALRAQATADAEAFERELAARRVVAAERARAAVAEANARMRATQETWRAAERASAALRKEAAVAEERHRAALAAQAAAAERRLRCAVERKRLEVQLSAATSSLQELRARLEELSQRRQALAVLAADLAAQQAAGRACAATASSAAGVLAMRAAVRDGLPLAPAAALIAPGDATCDTILRSLPQETMAQGVPTLDALRLQLAHAGRRARQLALLPVAEKESDDPFAPSMQPGFLSRAVAVLAAALRMPEGAHVSTPRGSIWRPVPDGGGVEALLGRCERLLEEGRLVECAAELEKAGEGDGAVGWEARRALEGLKAKLLRRAEAQQAVEALTAAEALRAMA